MRLDKASLEKTSEMKPLDKNKAIKLDHLANSEPVRCDSLKQESSTTETASLDHFKQLKDGKKIVFHSEEDYSLGDVCHSKNEEPLLTLKTESHIMAQSDMDSTRGQSSQGRPHVFVFVDDSVDVKAKVCTDKKLTPIHLGDRKYNARKVYHDNDVTVYGVLRSILGFKFELSAFMKQFKVTQISGFIVHPLTKVSDLIQRDNHLILSRRKSGNPGFDKSLRKKRQVFGLENLGNTCFMNSALQCILACYEFADHFLLLNKTLFDINRMPLTKAMHQLIGYGEDRVDIVAPIAIKQRLGERRSIYSEIKEQDAVEFINDLFDVIHEEIVKGTDGRYLDFYTDKSNLEGEKEIHEDEDLPWSAEIDYRAWLNKNRSIITDLFFSKMKSSIVCTSCGATRSIFEPNLVHPVPVPGEGFYFENIVLFYDSPQKVPLKVFAKSEITIEDLKELLYSDYDIQFDILFVITGSKGNMTRVPDNTVLSNIVGTLYCYEYRKEQQSKYFWVSIISRSIWCSYYFDFNFLVKLDEMDENKLYDILKCRLTPFLDHNTAFMLYENIQQLFLLDLVEGSASDSSNILDRPFIRLTMSSYNYKRLFGVGFDPLKSIIQLLSKPITLTDCINLFLEKEYIYGREKKMCDVCSLPSVFYKKLDFEEFPKYLIVQLKRFKFNGKSFEKLESFIDFPTDYITVQGVKYNLVAVSNHISSSSFKSIGSNGHYVAYVKKDVWYYCNDINVVPLKEPIDKKNAYIFFLERCT